MEPWFAVALCLLLGLLVLIAVLIGIGIVLLIGLKNDMSEIQHAFIGLASDSEAGDEAFAYEVQVLRDRLDALESDDL